MDDLICTLALKKIEGIKNSYIFLLLNHFENPCDIFSAPKSEFLKIGLPKKCIDILENSRVVRTAFFSAINEIDEAAKNNIKIIAFKSPFYPSNLLLVKDKPPILYYKGVLKENLRFAVAVVGQRTPPKYAVQIAENITKDIGLSGFSIISGLASGIDTAAHTCALKYGIYTAAFIGSGLLEPVYPPENRELFQEILLKDGAIISELSLHTKLSSKNLVARDRLQSGSSLSVFAISSGISSGTMKTCNFAIKQKRPIFIPDYPLKLMSEDSNMGLMTLANKQGVNKFNVDNTDLNDIIDEIRIVYNDLYEEKTDKHGFLLEQPELFKY
jgi:DNA processing protein